MTEVHQQTWTERNKDTILLILDQVICETGQSQFQYLSEGLNPEQIGKQIDKALSENMRLSSSEMPDYNNEWVALFYFLWYQPKQIQLAYRSISYLLQSRKIDLHGNLYMVDYACGSLATLYGFILALTDYIDRGETVDHIIIDFVDESSCMTKLGEISWGNFKSSIGNNQLTNHISGNNKLQQALKVINKHPLHIFCNKDNPFKVRSIIEHYIWFHNIWFIMLHGLYEININKVTIEFQNMLATYGRYLPNLGLFSSQDSKAVLVDKATKAVSSFSSSMPIDIFPNIWTNKLEKTTQLRNNMAQNYPIKKQALLRKNVTFNLSSPNSAPYIKYITESGWQETNLHTRG